MNVDVCDRKLNFICERGLFMNELVLLSLIDFFVQLLIDVVH